MAPYIYADTVTSTSIDVESLTSSNILAPYIYAHTVTSSLIDVESLKSYNILANTVTASYFVGDGSGLTNISGSVDVDSNGNLVVVDLEPH